MEPLQPNQNQANPLQNPPQNLAQTPPQNPTEAQKVIPANEEYKPETAQMRTFSTDLATELRKHQGSAMKIAVMENEKRFREQEDKSNEPKKNRMLIVYGLIILLLAISIALGVYFYTKKINTPPVIQINQTPASIIHSENLKTLNVTKMSASDIAADFVDTVKKATTPTGMIDNIYITEGPVGSETRLTSSMFLSAIGAHTTQEFTNNLTEDYMVGIYAYTQPNLFIVLRGTQHDSMLAGMLQWEPYMFYDLAPFFGIDTTGDNSYLLNNSMSETLIENHDTRAILNKNNIPVLFYSFLDQNTIIITNDAKTLSEAVRRTSI